MLDPNRLSVGMAPHAHVRSKTHVREYSLVNAWDGQLLSAELSPHEQMIRQAARSWAQVVG